MVAIKQLIRLKTPGFDRSLETPDVPINKQWNLSHNRWISDFKNFRTIAVVDSDSKSYCAIDCSTKNASVFARILFKKIQDSNYHYTDYEYGEIRSGLIIRTFARIAGKLGLGRLFTGIVRLMILERKEEPQTNVFDNPIEMGEDEYPSDLESIRVRERMNKALDIPDDKSERSRRMLSEAWSQASSYAPSEIDNRSDATRSRSSSSASNLSDISMETVDYFKKIFGSENE